MLLAGTVLAGHRSRRGAGVAGGDAMPIFDFRCEDCSQTFELLVRGDVPVCPHCGSQRLVKMLSAPNVAGKSKEIIASARRQAAREGHFSNYSRSEKPRR
jgi:putative FmdB family regulatory protein